MRKDTRVINLTIIQKLSDYEKMMREKGINLNRDLTTRKITKTEIYSCYMANYFVLQFFNDLNVDTIWKRDKNLYELYKRCYRKFDTFNNFSYEFYSEYSYNEKEWKSILDDSIKEFIKQYNFTIAYLTSLQAAIITHMSNYSRYIW